MARWRGCHGALARVHAGWLVAIDIRRGNLADVMANSLESMCAGHLVFVPRRRADLREALAQSGCAIPLFHHSRCTEVFLQGEASLTSVLFTYSFVIFFFILLSDSCSTHLFNCQAFHAVGSRLATSNRHLVARVAEIYSNLTGA